MRKKKHNLPKYITINHGKYQVRIPNNEGKVISIGTYDELVDAVICRDDTIDGIQQGIIDLSTYSANKYPKGITDSRHNTFRARVDIKNKQYGIGSYKTVEEAVEARKEFILNLL